MSKLSLDESRGVSTLRWLPVTFVILLIAALIGWVWFWGASEGGPQRQANIQQFHEWAEEMCEELESVGRFEDAAFESERAAEILERWGADERATAMKENADRLRELANTSSPPPSAQ